MVLSDPGGPPVDGTHNWESGFLPPLYQGTVLRPQEPRILNLDPPPHLRGEVQARNLAFLDGLNRRHLERHPGEADLEARIRTLRAGRRDADRRQGGARRLERARAHQEDCTGSTRTTPASTGRAA